MNSSSLTIIFVIIVIVVLLLILIISILNKGNNPNKKTKTKSSNSDDYVKLPSSIGLFLPPTIEKIGIHESHDISRKVFDLYKYFDYKNMSLDDLDKKEWHSWQISLILGLFKHNEEFFIPNQNDMFHPFLLNATDNDVKSFMNSILKKYKGYVDIDFTKDKLSKDYIWSNRDISIIFYFLANYKNYK